jgi:hypothetical protein
VEEREKELEEIRKERERERADAEQDDGVDAGTEKLEEPAVPYASFDDLPVKERPVQEAEDPPDQPDQPAQPDAFLDPLAPVRIFDCPHCGSACVLELETSAMKFGDDGSDDPVYWHCACTNREERGEGACGRTYEQIPDELYRRTPTPLPTTTVPTPVPTQVRLPALGPTKTATATTATTPVKQARVGISGPKPPVPLVPTDDTPKLDGNGNGNGKVETQAEQLARLRRERGTEKRK